MLGFGRGFACRSVSASFFYNAKFRRKRTKLKAFRDKTLKPAPGELGRGIGSMCAAPPFDGEAPFPLPRWDLPPHVFLPRPR